MVRRSLLLTVLLLAGALFLGACGSDDPPGSTTEDPEQESGGDDADPGDDAGDEGEDEDPYYEGAVIEVYLPTGPGGGADAQLQTLLPFLEKHIAGNPQFDVQYIEGAGGVMGGNEFAIRGEPGMSAMFTTFSSRMAWALGQPEVEYDLGDSPIMVAMPIGATLIVNTNTGISEIGHLQDPPTDLFMGGQSPTGQGTMHLLALELLGVRENIDIVWGYGGTADRQLMLEQGELNIDGTSDPNWLQDDERLQEEHGIYPILTYGYFNDDGELENPLFPGIPTLEEAYEELHGELPSGTLYDAFRTIYGVINAGSTFVLHGDAPPEALEAFRAGAAAAVEDPEFLAAQENLGLPVPAIGGDGVRVTEELMLGADRDVLDWVSDWLHEHYPEQMG